jgi:hypothetical protein
VRGVVHEGAEVAREEVVVEEEVVGDQLVGAVTRVAGEVVAGDDRDLPGGKRTPRMANCV